MSAASCRGCACSRGPEALFGSPSVVLRRDWAVKEDGSIVRSARGTAGRGNPVLRRRRRAAGRSRERPRVRVRDRTLGGGRAGPATGRGAHRALVGGRPVRRALPVPVCGRDREGARAAGTQRESGGDELEPEARAPLDVLVLVTQIQDMDPVRFEHVLVCVKAGRLAGGQELARRRAGKRAAAATAKNEEAKPSEKKRGRGGNEHDDRGQEARERGADRRHERALLETLGWPGRMISASKNGTGSSIPITSRSSTRTSAPPRASCGTGYTPTCDERLLLELANRIGATSYVLYEGDGGSHEERPLLSEAVYSVTEDGHTRFAYRYVQRCGRVLRHRPPPPQSWRRLAWHDRRPRLWRFWKAELVRSGPRNPEGAEQPALPGPARRRRSYRPRLAAAGTRTTLLRLSRPRIGRGVARPSNTPRGRCSGSVRLPPPPHLALPQPQRWPGLTYEFHLGIKMAAAAVTGMPTEPTRISGRRRHAPELPQSGRGDRGCPRQIPTDPPGRRPRLAPPPAPGRASPSSCACSATPTLDAVFVEGQLTTPPTLVSRIEAAPGPLVELHHPPPGGRGPLVGAPRRPLDPGAVSASSPSAAATPSTKESSTNQDLRLVARRNAHRPGSRRDPRRPHSGRRDRQPRLPSRDRPRPRLRSGARDGRTPTTTPPHPPRTPAAGSTTTATSTTHTTPSTKTVTGRPTSWASTASTTPNTHSTPSTSTPSRSSSTRDTP